MRTHFMFSGLALSVVSMSTIALAKSTLHIEQPLLVCNTVEIVTLKAEAEYNPQTARSNDNYLRVKTLLAPAVENLLSAKGVEHSLKTLTPYLFDNQLSLENLLVKFSTGFKDLVAKKSQVLGALFEVSSAQEVKRYVMIEEAAAEGEILLRIGYFKPAIPGTYASSGPFVGENEPLFLQNCSVNTEVSINQFQ